ncbi:hypothetical protein K1T71_002366 [Dendrolimus kikuchii]|uniref:Uncharacterized protein n=1 Tax=Dendrolimus kikuchii TaxID=765133 RepID=A0ACC1DD29_9NEOP|nr:hypothetical protein K1T71_002366 [Dendrolimus kikuchii]
MKLIFFSPVLLLLFLNSIKCDSQCNSQKTCGDCIGYAAMKCVWCAKEDMKEHRCESEELVKHDKSWCPIDLLYNPDLKMKETLNNDFKPIVNGSEAIQFRPQKIDIKVRPGIPVKFEMSYKPAEDFPLDVYFLMDISYSMKSVKEELRNQAYEIFNHLTVLSNNVRLGIGSFVEKPAYPYYDKNQPHSTSYSFKNDLALTKDVQKFKDVIDASPTGANFDDLEAGFDALMQAMTCVEEIKWRNNSRRIIVYVTESAYHSVGDGKMIGIIKPNDMKCHYKDGLHQTALDLDYPSVSQINAIALEKKIKIIFVAKPVVKDVYVALENYILDSKYEELKAGSKTVEIIERAYKELTANVALDRRDWPEFIDLILEQDCKSSTQSNCKITPAQPIVTIPATLKVNSCPKEKFHKLEIGPRSASDILTINLEIDCECECEKKNALVSPKCNNAGFYQCGVCKCNTGSYGDDCGCSGTFSAAEYFNKCRANQNDTNLCSGRGICRCGKCEECPGFSGEFCQYDNTACPQYNDKLCAGNGKCALGKCQCGNSWTKDDCSCSLTNDNCIAPYSSEICSGHGTCKCGECICDKIKEDKDERYAGNFCDSCDDCAEKRCKELEDYVFCYYMNNTCDQFLNQTSRTVISMASKEEFQSPTPEWRGAKKCEKILDSNEAIVFMFRTDETTRKLHILVQKEMKPPNKANIIIAVSSAIAAVLLIGLLTVIIWKILIDLHDAREYKKFEQQAKGEGYDVSQNPLYTEPATNFRNPAYDENEHSAINKI